MNLNELRDKAYHCALSHGLHKKDFSNKHFLCLVISDLTKAITAEKLNRHAKVERFKDYFVRMKYQKEYEKSIFLSSFEYIIYSVEDELANAFIHLFDLAGLRNIDLDCFEYEKGDHKDYSDLYFTESMFEIIKYATEGSQENWELDHNIYMMLNELLYFCKENDIDIFFFIEQKMKYNQYQD